MAHIDNVRGLVDHLESILSDLNRESGEACRNADRIRTALIGGQMKGIKQALQIIKQWTKEG